MAFERVDVLVAFGPEARPAVARGQPLCVQPFGVHPQGDDLLVVGAVEDADASTLGQRVRDPPEEVVVELLARRLPERDDVHALRVHARHDVLDRRVLAGSVHRLEHQEQRVRVARPEQLLGVLQSLDSPTEDLLGRCVQLARRELVELAATGPARVTPGQVRLRARLHPQCPQDSISSVHVRLLGIAPTTSVIIYDLIAGSVNPRQTSARRHADVDHPPSAPVRSSRFEACSQSRDDGRGGKGGDIEV